MENSHTIEVIDGVTVIRFERTPTYEEARAAIDDLAANFPYELRLWDFSSSDFDFSMTEIRNIAEYGKQRFVRPNSAAVVAPTDLAYGELRAFEVYRVEEGHSKARVFRTEAEALRWLKGQR